MKILSIFIGCWINFFFISGVSAGEKQTINIITPYPEALSSAFQLGFEQAHQDIKVNVLNTESTEDALNYIQDKHNTGATDLFWASSASAFDTLKKSGKLQAFRPEVRGLPDSISGVRLNDKEGYYTGFSVAGYGYLLNERYLNAWRLPVPKRWSDLARTLYHNHLSMATPGLSGSTHTIIESILQGGEWRERWYLVRRIAGNMKKLLPESSAVALGVRDGEFAIGTTIDYDGLPMHAARYPVRFIYPEKPILSGAYIGVLQDSPNPDAAKRFITYLLSEDGQALLFHKNIGRLPIRSDVYQQAPANYPNPFENKVFRRQGVINPDIAKQRYQLINTLFDKLITFNLNELKMAVKSMQCVEQALLSQKHEEAEQLLKLAKAAVSWLPVDEKILEDADYLWAFEQENALPHWSQEKIAEKGIAYAPDRWSRQAWAYYQQAKSLADQAIKLMDKECE